MERKGWNEARLLDHIELVKSGVEPFEGTKKYVATGSLQKGEIIDSAEVTYKNRPSRANMEAKENDILFAKMKDTKKVFLVSNITKDYIFSTGFFILRVKYNNKIMPKYVYYWIRSNYFQKIKNNYCTGATQKAINNSNLNKLRIFFPDSYHQQKIVEKLDKVENSKKWRRKSNKLTRKYNFSVFIDMFGDPKSNPKKFKTVYLKDLLIRSPQNGIYKHVDYYTSDKDGTPILRIDSFYDGEIKNIENLKRLYCSNEEIERYKLQKDDILINRVNSIEYLGKCCLVRQIYEPTVFESNMMRLKIDNSKVNPTYLVKFLCTKFIYSQIINKSKKAVNQASINQTDVNDLKIILPPLNLQNDYVNFIGIIEKCIKYQTIVDEKLDNLSKNIEKIILEVR